MVRLRRPSPSEIDAVLRTAAGPTYAEVGDSALIGSHDGPLRAAGYDVDRRLFPLGTGRACFDRARTGLAHWKHFEIPWLEFHGGGSPSATGQVVATLVSVAGVWFLNPCRVLASPRVETGDVFEFAYGTLPGHAERGEERFRVSIDPRTDAVTYEIAAFSTPAIWLTWLGYPFARKLQARFAAASAAALARATEDRA